MQGPGFAWERKKLGARRYELSAAVYPYSTRSGDSPLRPANVSLAHGSLGPNLG